MIDSAVPGREIDDQRLDALIYLLLGKKPSAARFRGVLYRLDIKSKNFVSPDCYDVDSPVG